MADVMAGSAELTAWIAQTGFENLVWTTDLDLTLLDSHADPNMVAAPPELAHACRRLDELTQGRFFIITGRELDYVDKVFPGMGFKASCEYHNMFRLRPDEVRELSPRPQWHLVEADLNALVAEHPGMVVRVKPFMRSVHYSHAESLRDEGVKTAVIARLQAMLDSIEQATGQKIRNTDGGKVFDMGPDGLDKGEALEAIMAHAKNIAAADPAAAGRTLVPLYFGDSPGDLPAALAVQKHGGKFVAVGCDPRVQAVADFRLDSPAECRALLTAVAQGHKPQPGRDTSRKPGFEPS